MRHFVPAVLFFAAVLSYHLFHDSPRASGHVHVERDALRGEGAMVAREAELFAVDSASARTVAAPNAGTDAHAALRTATVPVSTPIKVIVRWNDPLKATSSLVGLRVVARSCKTKERFEGLPVAEDGTTEVRVSGSGRFRVVIHPDSVPGGCLGSGAVALGALDESGIAGAFVEVEEGEAAAATLTLFTTSSLGGSVTGPGGLPMGGATVRAQGIAPGMAGLSHDAVTNELGEFEIDGLLPFVYGVSLVDAGTDADDISELPRAPRQLFDLKYGPYLGVHLSLGSGQVTLAGTVVDERGEPFADVGVRAYYVEDEAHGVVLDFPRVYSWSDHAFSARTDAKGGFRVEGVRGVPIRIQVGAAEAANGAGRRAKFVPDPVDVKLGAGSHGLVETGPIELVRSRRFVVEGHIALGKAEHPELRLKHSRVELQVSPYERAEPTAKRPGQETQPYVDYDRRTGRFTLSCDTPLDDCTLTLALRGHPSMDKEYRFRPAPNETLAGQVLSFP